jgi:hypothetical protein
MPVAYDQSSALQKPAQGHWLELSAIETGGAQILRSEGGEFASLRCCRIGRRPEREPDVASAFAPVGITV